MSSLTYQKGLKTRYKTFLERELSKIHPLLSERLDEDSIDNVIHRTGLLLNKIKDLSCKYDSACEKFMSMTEDSEAKVELAKLQELDLENTAFCDRVLEGIAELSTFEKELLDTKIKIEQKPSSVLNETLSRMADLLEAQHLQLQQGNNREPREQNNSNHVSVRLPTLDMPSFGGDIISWKPFWDLFESTVDKNCRLSSAEKLTYLKSKLFGEALKSIEGLSLSNENYAVAVDLLLERYGDKQLMINAHYTKLMDLPMASNNIGTLRHFYDELEKHLRSLQAHGEDISQAIFVSLITSKIPKDILIQLEIQKGKDSWSVMKLRALFGEYISAREAAERVASANRNYDKPRSYPSNSSVSSRDFSYKPKSTAEALVTNPGESSGQPRTGCRFCGDLHWSDECMAYTTVERRKQRVKGCCYLCLRKGHRINQCRYEKPCFHCHRVGLHHRSLCPIKYSANESSHLSGEIPLDLSKSGNEPTMLSSGETVFMQTATTRIRKPNTEFGQNTRLLLDSGSQRTYITSGLAHKLNLTIEKDQAEINVVTFGTDKAQKIKISTATLELQLSDGTYLPIKANVVPHITGKLHRSPVNLDNCESWNYLWKNQSLADHLPIEQEQSNLNLLVGNDYYLDIILPQKVELTPGLYLLGSRLGWILSGRTATSSHQNTSNSSLSLLTMDKHLKMDPCVLVTPDAALPTKPNLVKTWPSKIIDITDPTADSSDDIAIAQFDETLQKDSERYLVTCPWKETEPQLPHNIGLALGQIKSVLNRLKHKKLYNRFDAITGKQEREGIQWQFITELSPRICGFYGRFLRLLKPCVLKSLGKVFLSTVPMETYLREVESVINSTPLKYVGEDINSFTAITPSDFLTLNPRKTLPPPVADQSDPEYEHKETSADGILKLWKKGQRRLEQFWNCWRNDYLTSLRERFQSSLKGPRAQSPFYPQIGDVVLIKDNLPRSSWRFGKIHSLTVSKDGLVRSATVILPSKKLLSRPVSLLYPVECPGSQTMDTGLMKPSDQKEERKTVSTRSNQRQAAIVARKRIAQQLN